MADQQTLIDTPTVWTKSKIQSLVTNNEKAAIRALKVVYANQSDFEKEVGTTVADNGIGFTGSDAELLTSFAKQYQRAGFLTNAQLAILKFRIKKYWRQLLKAVEAKGQPVTYSPSL